MITEDVMGKTIDRGMSMLNATDETANPYGLILSKVERETIYGDLTRLDNMTNALLYGRTGLKQQARAAFTALWELGAVSFATIGLHNFFGGPPVLSAFMIVFAFIVLQKLNLLLTHEKLEDTDARREREAKKEAKRRAQYFKDMGAKDLSLEE